MALRGQSHDLLLAGIGSIESLAVSAKQLAFCGVALLLFFRNPQLRAPEKSDMPAEAAIGFNPDNRSDSTGLARKVIFEFVLNYID